MNELLQPSCNPLRFNRYMVECEFLYDRDQIGWQ